jgi:hypothetical protein
MTLFSQAENLSKDMKENPGPSEERLLRFRTCIESSKNASTQEVAAAVSARAFGSEREPFKIGRC